MHAPPDVVRSQSGQCLGVGLMKAIAHGDEEILDDRRHVAAVAEHAAHQFKKELFGKLAAPDLGGEGTHESFEHFFNGDRLAGGPFFEHFQAGQAFLVHRIDIARHHDGHQSFAAAEVIVHRRHVGRSLGRNVAHGNPIKAFVGKQGLRCFNQTLLGCHLGIPRDHIHERKLDTGLPGVKRLIQSPARVLTQIPPTHGIASL